MTGFCVALNAPGPGKKLVHMLRNKQSSDLTLLTLPTGATWS